MKCWQRYTNGFPVGLKVDGRCHKTHACSIDLVAVRLDLTRFKAIFDMFAFHASHVPFLVWLPATSFTITSKLGQGLGSILMATFGPIFGRESLRSLVPDILLQTPRLYYHSNSEEFDGSRVVGFEAPGLMI